MLKNKLNSIPAVLMWLMLIMPFLGVLLLKQNFIFILFPLYLFWFYRSSFFVFGSLLGFIKYKIFQNNFNKNLNKDFNYNLPNQVVCFATYGESLSVLKKSIDSVVNQNYPNSKIFISVSFEERKYPNNKDFEKIKKAMEKDYNPKLTNKIKIFLHPNNLDGEVNGAAANRTWCVKKSLESIKNLDSEKTLVTSPDADTRLGKNYLLIVGNEWIKDNYSKKIFYMPAMYRFDNNFWDVPLLVRVLSEGLTMSIISSSALDSKNRYTFSCFTLSSKTFSSVNFWDTTLPIDDTPFYWKPFNKFGGEFYCKSVYEAVYSNAVKNKKYIKNHIDQYHQYYRWGWGAISFELAIKTIIKARKLSILKKIIKIYKAFEIFVLNKSITIFISLSFLYINTYKINLSNQIGLYSILMFLVKISIFFIFPTLLVKLLLMPKPKNLNQIFLMFTHLLTVLPAGFIVLVSYTFLPYLHSYTVLMINSLKVDGIKWAIKDE